MGLRAGLYSRVSADPGGRSQSVDQQAAAGRAAAAEHGWTLTEYSESGSASASRYATMVRPEWARLLADVKAGRLDLVSIWEPSRGGRELEAWAAFLNTARAAGCQVYVTSHHQLYDLSRARDWRSLAEDGIDSAYESEKTSLRVKRAYVAAYEDGRPMGRPAYGLARRYDQDTRALVGQYPDPETAPIVADLITRIAASEAISHLVADLYDRGIVSPTGQPRWARNSVIRLVKDGLVYIGKRRGQDGSILDGSWEPLVPEDVYWAAVRVLADPARKAQADRRGGVRPGAARWLASYIATCGKCGAPLNVVSRKSGPVYRCSSSGAGCAGAPVDWLDALISAAIVAWCARPEIFAELTRSDSAESVSALGEAAAGRDRLAGLEAQCIAGEISGSSFARLAAGLESRIAELERSASESGTSPVLRDLLKGAESPEGRENIIGQMFSTMPLTAKRKVISTLCDIRLSPVGEFAADSPWRVRLSWRTG
jgi:site-specific DNA recombinase